MWGLSVISALLAALCAIIGFLYPPTSNEGVVLKVFFVLFAILAAVIGIKILTPR